MKNRSRMAGVGYLKPIVGLFPASLVAQSCYEIPSSRLDMLLELTSGIKRIQCIIIVHVDHQAQASVVT